MESVCRQNARLVARVRGCVKRGAKVGVATCFFFGGLTLSLHQIFLFFVHPRKFPIPHHLSPTPCPLSTRAKSSPSTAALRLVCSLVASICFYLPSSHQSFPHAASGRVGPVLHAATSRARSDARLRWNRGVWPCWNRHMEMLDSATSSTGTSIQPCSHAAVMQSCHRWSSYDRDVVVLQPTTGRLDVFFLLDLVFLFARTS